MTNEIAGVPADGNPGTHSRLLFWACFVALVATAFAFVTRGFIIHDLQVEFGLSETHKGEILGAGLWPFGISIVLFSLIIDRIGYGMAMIFAFACHVASAVLIIFATGYWDLYIGACLCGLAAGTVEAVVNPVVATMFPKHKTKMLTILHAGWAGGVALGGILTLGIGALGGAGWQTKVGLLFIPTALYGLMMLWCKFPVNERVAAGVPYRDMLKECGIFGALIVSYLIVMEVGRILGWPAYLRNDVVLLLIFCYGIYAMDFGRFMYSFLLLVMILLAITELGTDGWIKELMKPAMKGIGLDSGWVLVYTATIMMLLRFCIGPIVKVLKPLGVLLVSSLFAAGGLYFLAGAEGVWIILIAATVYGVGQTFFWPVTIGLVAERFPRGGALTINAIAGVGMLGVGIIGLPLLGNLQDKKIDHALEPHRGAYVRLIDPAEKTSVFGRYKALNRRKINEIEDKVALYKYRAEQAKKLSGDELAQALLTDKEYQTLVRNAYDHLIRVAGDTETKSHQTMDQALEAQGVFVDADEFPSVNADKELIDGVTAEAKKNAMATIAILPLVMALCYLGLIVYFKARGGYRPVDLMAEAGKSSGDA